MASLKSLFFINKIVKNKNKIKVEVLFSVYSRAQVRTYLRAGRGGGGEAFCVQSWLRMCVCLISRPQFPLGAAAPQFSHELRVLAHRESGVV